MSAILTATESSGMGRPTPARTARAVPSAGPFSGQERAKDMTVEYLSDDINTLFVRRMVSCIERKGIDNNPHLANALVNKCESEIERRMLVELVFCPEWEFCDYSQIEIYDSSLCGQLNPRAFVTLAPQYQVERYRIDIAVIVSGMSGEALKIAVECDGHDYHERTKKQASRDKLRDRKLQQAGWMVFRFTGSDIFNKGPQCAAEVAEYVGGWIHGTLDELMKK